ncbi:MAG: hypothetical protein LC796_10940 [Acidobacteria bacterium]|nr:hypothetical protein [Acidobacteriota bacterium]MCA1617338.1 hypothetical protein [Acidobacteriota bacterium]
MADIPAAPERLVEDDDVPPLDLIPVDFLAPDDFALDFFAPDFFAVERAVFLPERVPEEDFRADDFFAPPEEARPRAEAPLRIVFFAPPELFPLPLLAAFPADFFFLATLCSSSPGFRRCPDHTIPKVPNRDGERVQIMPLASGLRIEIGPLVRRRRDRLRLLGVAAALLTATLFGGARLVSAWDSGLRKGDFSDLPLSALLALSIAVGVSTPFALLGLSALAFAEETVVVGPDEIVIETAVFERITRTRIARDGLECWRETFVPLPPWWTWAVERLAARAGGRLLPLAGMAGPKEKRRIAEALARATGKPIVRDFGRHRETEEVSGGSGEIRDKIPR